jgi:hypothetical protein
LNIGVEKMATIIAVKKHITSVIFLVTAALGAILDMKPASAINFTHVFFHLQLVHLHLIHIKLHVEFYLLGGFWI